MGGIEGAWWAAWNVDVEVLLPAAFLAYCYLRGAGRLRRRTHPCWRTVLFLGGMLAIVLAVQSPIDRLGEHQFTFHMIQHELLILLGAPLVLLGAPVTPVLLGLPRWMRRDLVRPVARSRTGTCSAACSHTPP